MRPARLTVGKGVSALKFHYEKSIYFRWGVTAFLTVAAILAVYDIFWGEHKIASYLDFLGGIVTPIVYGCAIAYLLAPIVDFLERTLLRSWAGPARLARKPRMGVRITSVLLTLAIVFGAIAFLLYFLIQDVAASVLQLIESIPMYVQLVQGWLQEMDNTVTLPPEMAEKAAELYAQGMEKVREVTDVGVPAMIATVTGGVMGVFGFFGNLVVGTVVAAYMMGMKETLAAQGKKIICALFETNWAEKVLAALRYTDEVFGGFIRGNIIDSIIVGVICFVAFQFMGIPYAPLLSVLIAVTNLIPFFGPFLGAIPSCILIFLVSPIKCLEFIIFILVLQQLDGNILAPKIFGQSTGIASLWVIIAILIGGGLFGPIGMLLGCPAFALIYTAVRLLVEWRLEKKQMPAPTDVYRCAGIPEKTWERKE